MAGRKSDFTLPTNTLDDLFSSQEERDEAKLQKIRDIPLAEIDGFPNHPFQVREDEDMFQLVESIKPDLQSRDNQIGIEVTEAISKKDAQISGLFSSYRNGKCRTDKWKDIVKKNGGKVALDGSNITYPTITSEDEWKTICEIYEKKMDKIMSYRQKGFEKLGLIIICSDSLIPVKKETMEKSMKAISEKFKEKYDFVF